MSVCKAFATFVLPLTQLILYTCFTIGYVMGMSSSDHLYENLFFHVLTAAGACWAAARIQHQAILARDAIVAYQAEMQVVRDLIMAQQAAPQVAHTNWGSVGYSAI